MATVGENRRGADTPQYTKGAVCTRVLGEIGAEIKISESIGGHAQFPKTVGGIVPNDLRMAFALAQRCSYAEISLSLLNKIERRPRLPASGRR
jgi:hypothetical protein